MSSRTGACSSEHYRRANLNAGNSSHSQSYKLIVTPVTVSDDVQVDESLFQDMEDLDLDEELDED